MTIPPEHLTIEADNRLPSGGQTCGLLPCGVTVTHSSGLKAYCNYMSSQLKNKQIAIEMIEWGCAQLKFYG